jgi:hypothetical protein
MKHDSTMEMGIGTRNDFMNNIGRPCAFWDVYRVNKDSPLEVKGCHEAQRWG